MTGSDGQQEREALEQQLERYLAIRGLTLKYADLPHGERLTAQAAYVVGEAEELLAASDKETVVEGYDEQMMRHELADVVLACATLARYLGTTVEACIEEKTVADAGRSS